MTGFEPPAPPIQAIPRDRWGRPLVQPPGGGRPVAYTRCTTFVSALEDTYNLARWQQRMVATGLAERPDLLLAAGAHRDDKAQLNKICEQALEAARASSAATVGTALHALTERLDRGQKLGVLPDSASEDLAAYKFATADLEIHAIEQFCVLDELKIGGTPDRIVSLNGTRYVADIKTGSVDFGAGKICMQLAVYAASRAYHGGPQARREPLDVDQSRAIVIHLPAGEGRCELLWADIEAGWQAVGLAHEVRVWRTRKGLLDPLGPPPASPVALTEHTPDPPAVRVRIAQAASVAELEQIWREASAAGQWSDEFIGLCAQQKEKITKGAIK